MKHCSKMGSGSFYCIHSSMYIYKSCNCKSNSKSRFGLTFCKDKIGSIINFSTLSPKLVTLESCPQISMGKFLKFALTRVREFAVDL